MVKISYIIPCFNNEKNIVPTLTKLIECEKKFSDLEFEYITVDDGSKDNTYFELSKFKSLYPKKLKIIKLSGNFGSHNALLAGMNYATGNCHVILAADLQDPPELVSKMFNYWENGIMLVIANRNNREDPFFSKLFATFFHFIFRKISVLDMPKGGFDLVLFDDRIRKEIVKMNGKNTNHLMLMLTLKYDYVSIPYNRRKRIHGKSKWTFQKKVKLLIDTFISFSYLPLRIISLSGLIFGIIGLIYIIIIIKSYLTGSVSVKGWSPIMCVLLLSSSFLMISIGIIGEYLWRILDEVKGIPNYIVEKENL